MSGCWCPPNKQSDRSVKVVTFIDIKKAFAFPRRDRFFTVGDAVIFRAQGSPMGGPLSEPGTLIDLQEPIRCAIGNKSSRFDFVGLGLGESGGGTLKDYRFGQIAQGVQHVDDAAVFSNILCVHCLEILVKKLWPEDVGVSIEVGPCDPIS